MDNKDKTNIKESGILGIIRKQDKILGKIREIVREASDGEYIYRGQSGIYRPKSDDDGTFPKVTSTLYRALYRKMEKYYEESNDDELLKLRKLREWRNMEHDMNFAQAGVLEAAREFADEDCKDKKILSLIQHYSGDTNLIDFTNDYHIALFFACSHKYGKTDGEDGEVFLLDESKLKDSEIETIIPAHPRNRVITQKSIFLQSRTGFIPIKEGLMKVVKIPCKLKQPILHYLKEHHEVSLPTIYNDLHGYVRSSKEHGDAAMELYLGLDYNYQYNKAQSLKEKSNIAEKAIEHYNKAILLDPKYVRAYYSRANAKKALGSLKSAVEDYSEVIKLNRNYAEAYHKRGLIKETFGGKENLQQSLSDLKYAKKLARQQNKKDMENDAQKDIERVIEKSK